MQIQMLFITASGKTPPTMILKWILLELFPSQMLVIAPIYCCCVIHMIILLLLTLFSF